MFERYCIAARSLASGVVILACLHGCADPIDLVMYGMQAADNTPAYQPPVPTAQPVTPEMMGLYRKNFDCKRLGEMYEEYRKPQYKELMTYEAAAMVQIAGEKGCPKIDSAPAAPVTASAPATAPGQPVTLVAAPSPDRGLGIAVETLSTSIAAAVGLSPAQGALVIAVPKGSAGDKGGLKAMDVIVEVSGQAVVDAATLEAIVNAMRVGYKAPVRVWREHAMKDLLVTVSHSTSVAVSGPVPVPVPAPTAAPQPPVAAPPAPVLKYCVAFMSTAHEPGGLITQPFEDLDSDGSKAWRLGTLREFIDAMKAKQPGQWGDFKFVGEPCIDGPEALCFVTAERGMFQHNQLAGEFCHTTMAEAAAHFRKMQKEDESTPMSWR